MDKSFLDNDLDFFHKKPELLILGIGNYLLKDEGVGIHFLRYFQKKYRLCNKVSLMEGGTLGLNFLPYLEGIPYLIVIDAANIKNAKPGDVRVFSKDDILNNRLPLKISPHEAHFSEVLQLLEIKGKSPKDCVLIGIQVKDISVGIDISEELKETFPKIENLVLKYAQKFLGGISECFQRNY